MQVLSSREFHLHQDLSLVFHFHSSLSIMDDAHAHSLCVCIRTGNVFCILISSLRSGSLLNRLGIQLHAKRNLQSPVRQHYFLEYFVVLTFFRPGPFLCMVCTLRCSSGKWQSFAKLRHKTVKNGNGSAIRTMGKRFCPRKKVQFQSCDGRNLCAFVKIIYLIYII